MKKIAVFGWAVLGILLFGCTSTYTNVTNVDDLDKNMVRKVIDCSGSPPPLTCTERGIATTVINCTHWVAHVSPLSELHCENTAAEAEEVGFVATPANHVRANLTTEKYTAEIHYDDGVIGGWDFAFSPEGGLFLTEIGGEVFKLTDGQFQGIKKTPSIRYGNSGLLGLVLDPEFEANGLVYLFYAHTFADNTTGSTRKVLNRVSKFTYRDGTLVDEVVLLDNIPGSTHHGGGRMAIGPDKLIYITLGDGDMGDGVPALSAQNKSSLYGKIIRMNLDGTVPYDNPFNGSYVYSYGHRNPQGLAWDAEGNLYESEHGDIRHDEVNLIKKGGNYGWPIAECDDGPYQEDFIDPLFCTKKWTLAPSGMVFVNSPGHPWDKSLFISSLQGIHVHRLLISNETVVKSEVFFYLNQTGTYRTDGKSKKTFDRRVRDVEFFNGSLWVLFDAAPEYAKLTPSKR